MQQLTMMLVRDSTGWKWLGIPVGYVCHTKAGIFFFYLVKTETLPTFIIICQLTVESANDSRHRWWKWCSFCYLYHMNNTGLNSLHEY